MGAEQLVGLISDTFSSFEALLANQSGTVIDTVG